MWLAITGDKSIENRIFHTAKSRFLEVPIMVIKYVFMFYYLVMLLNNSKFSIKIFKVLFCVNI